MPEIVRTFAELQEEFLQCVNRAVWCNCATVDARGRPRSRVLHPLWEGATGWVTSRRDTPKIRQIAANPFVSLAYIHDPFKPVYVECHAAWDDDLATRQRVWELFRNTPEPVGFDPAAVWGDIRNPDNGLLRLTPWRIEINDFSGPPRTVVWRAADVSLAQG